MMVPADNRLGRSDITRARRIRALVLVSKGQQNGHAPDLEYLQSHGLIEVGAKRWQITDEGRAVLCRFAANQNRHRAGS